jgi:hypothetical protein
VVLMAGWMFTPSLELTTNGKVTLASMLQTLVDNGVEVYIFMWKGDIPNLLKTDAQAVADCFADIVTAPPAHCQYGVESCLFGVRARHSRHIVLELPPEARDVLQLCHA